jgi:3-isopropylmalate/(R)-2-methylmalate dehydratase small subunit
MNPLKTFTGLVAPLDKINVDTDQIIPKQFLKSVEKSGFGKYLFYDWRYNQDGTPRPEFVLNQKMYENASVLLTRANFGCGSSREHAVWALRDFGFKTVIAPSFADIFYTNSLKNGLLAVRLSEEDVQSLFNVVKDFGPLRVVVDLEGQVVFLPMNKMKFEFEIDSFNKKMLLEALDEITLTLLQESRIEEYEEEEKRKRSYLHPALGM